uniref:Uncharacterized protein n=1 Tax=Panagrolaimus davidi TaxID=227884 RepID=A0A914QBC6_9BILA
MKQCSGIVYEKLIRTCKYFYSVERFLAIKDYTDDEGLGYFYPWGKQYSTLLLEKMAKENNQKIWFTGKLGLSYVDNEFIDYIWRCDITELFLDRHELYTTEFSKITKNLKRLNMTKARIYFLSKDGVHLIRTSEGDILAMITQLVEFY